MRTFLALICAGFALIGQLQAAVGTSIEIVNHDFEQGGFYTDVNSAFPGVAPTGWTLVDNGNPTGDFFGYWNPDNLAYFGTTGGTNAITGMNGPNVFYFGTLGLGQGITQVLSHQFQLGTDYSLVVGVGTRLDWIYMTGLTMKLSAGDQVIASRTLSASEYATEATAGTFRDFSLNYSWSAADFSLVGQNIEIGFFSEDGFEVDIDNVRLYAIPEPSTAGLMLFGALALARRRRS